jgi:hypothetical protein
VKCTLLLLDTLLILAKPLKQCIGQFLGSKCCKTLLYSNILESLFICQLHRVSCISIELITVSEVPSWEQKASYAAQYFRGQPALLLHVNARPLGSFRPLGSVPLDEPSAAPLTSEFDTKPYATRTVSCDQYRDETLPNSVPIYSNTPKNPLASPSPDLLSICSKVFRKVQRNFQD